MLANGLTELRRRLVRTWEANVRAGLFAGPWLTTLRHVIDPIRRGCSPLAVIRNIFALVNILFHMIFYLPILKKGGTGI
eukprot:775350-Lingulodinium_polyedra.AAC.1